MTFGVSVWGVLSLAGTSALLLRMVGTELSKQLKMPWTPRGSKKDGIHWHKDGSWMMQV